MGCALCAKIKHYANVWGILWRGGDDTPNEGVTFGLALKAFRNSLSLIVCKPCIDRGMEKKPPRYDVNFDSHASLITICMARLIRQFPVSPATVDQHNDL